MGTKRRRSTRMERIWPLVTKPLVVVSPRFQSLGRLGDRDSDSGVRRSQSQGGHGVGNSLSDEARKGVGDDALNDVDEGSAHLSDQIVNDLRWSWAVVLGVGSPPFGHALTSAEWLRRRPATGEIRQDSYNGVSPPPDSVRQLGRTQ